MRHVYFTKTKLYDAIFHGRYMETSLQFYVDKLGFVITKAVYPHGTIEWCWLQWDGVLVMVQANSG